jgi:hypothetical protein
LRSGAWFPGGGWLIFLLPAKAPDARVLFPGDKLQIQNDALRMPAKELRLKSDRNAKQKHRYSTPLK